MSRVRLVSSEGLDSLDKAFTQSAEDVIFTVTANLISNKLKKEGIKLSKSDIDTLAKELKSGDRKLFSFQTKYSSEDRVVRIDLNDEEMAKVEKAMEAFSAKLPELMQEQISTIANRTLKNLKKRWAKEFKAQELEIGDSRKRLFGRWAEAFQPLLMTLTISREIGANVRAKTTGKSHSHNRHVVEVVTRLHARACQVTDETIWLLRGGFSEGAFARWRTLHEIVTTSELILIGGEPLAKRFVDHQFIETLRAAEEYQRIHASLGYEPISDGEMQKIREKANKVILKYGKSFREPNGWAAELLKPHKPTFAAIEKAARSDKYRSHYRWASQGIHSGPKGIFKPQPHIGEVPVLMTGPSNGGLADPGHATAISLGRITANVVTLEPNFDLNMAMQVIVTLIDEAGQKFLSCHNELMKEEKEIEGQG
jgi:Family of unknown function (DUF5677)